MRIEKNKLQYRDISISLKARSRLRWLLQTCETLCVSGCCGLNAYNFSPLNIAFCLVPRREEIKIEENVEDIIDDIDWIIDEAKKYTPNEKGEVVVIDEMWESFTWVELITFTDLLKRNLSLASQVVAYSDQLTDVNLMKEIGWGDGRVHAPDRIVIPTCRLSFSGPQTNVTITIISPSDYKGVHNLRVSLSIKQNEKQKLPWKSPAYPCVTWSELKRLSDFLGSVEVIDETSDVFNSVDYTFQTSLFDVVKPDLAFQSDGVHFDVVLSDRFLPPWADELDDEFIVTIPCQRESFTHTYFSRNHKMLEEYMVAVKRELDNSSMVK